MNPGDRCANWSLVLVTQFKVTPVACIAEPTTNRSAAQVAAVELNPTVPTANANPKCIAACINVSTCAVARFRIGPAFIRSVPRSVPSRKPITRIAVP